MRPALLFVVLAACDGGGSNAVVDAGSEGPDAAVDFPDVPPWQPVDCTGTGSGAQVLCVDASAAAGGGDGSAAAPLTAVGAALTAARDGDLVLVAAATYAEDLSVAGQAIRLYGGFASGGDFQTRDPDANPTILRGSGDTAVLILSDAGASIVDGFRITGGGGRFDGFRTEGGGIWIDGGEVAIAHCVIDGNVAEGTDSFDRGGGISAYGTVAIVDNLIRDNRSARGAGLFVAGVAHIAGNRIEDNLGSGDHGGGLFLTGPSLLVEDNLIAGNEIGRALDYGWGGGVIVDAVGTTATLRRNTWTDNYAPTHGSAIFFDNGAEGTVDHELVYRNQCSDSGSALYVDALDDSGDNGSHVVFSFVTVADHACPGGEGHGLYIEGVASTATVEDSILWNNGDQTFDDGRGVATFTRTLSDELLPGDDNAVISDPEFVDPAAGDYHLARGSAAAGHGAFP